MSASTGTRGVGEYERLAPYMDTFRKYPPLSREDEHLLAVRSRGGDIAARQRLVRHNLAFVVAFASRHRRGTVRMEDVIQEGNVGLMRAVVKFDPDAGTRFSTYAIWWIRACIGKYVKEARSSVRPRSGTLARADLSLDSPVDETNDSTYLDRIEDEAPGPEEAYLANEAIGEVRGALGRIRGRVGELGWDIIQARMQQDERTTLEAIGERWGLSRERVRQVELRTKQILAECLQESRNDAA